MIWTGGSVRAGKKTKLRIEPGPLWKLAQELRGSADARAWDELAQAHWGGVADVDR